MTNNTSLTNDLSIQLSNMICYRDELIKLNFSKCSGTYVKELMKIHSLICSNLTYRIAIMTNLISVLFDLSQHSTTMDEEYHGHSSSGKNISNYLSTNTITYCNPNYFMLFSIYCADYYEKNKCASLLINNYRGDIND